MLIDRWVEFRQDEKRGYLLLWNRLILGISQYLKGNGEVTAVHILAAITSLRLHCLHPLLSLNENMESQQPVLEQYLKGERDKPLPPGGKLTVVFHDLRAILNADPASKVLIFSQWTKVLKIVAYYLKKMPSVFGDFLLLDGKTTQTQRKKMIEHFQSPNGPRVFLISMKAGGLGLNLTAANNVMLLDPYWNKAVEEQAIDRAHRCGQTRQVTVFRYLMRDIFDSDSIEKLIHTLQQRKTEHVDSICDDVLNKMDLPELKLFLRHIQRSQAQARNDAMRRKAKKMKHMGREDE